MGSKLVRSAVAVALVLGAASSLPAQPRRPRPSVGVPVPIAPPVISLPCCRCVDGGTTTVSIDTGTAPWGVSWPSVFGYPAVVPAANPAWAPVPPAQWVGPAGEPRDPGDYVYQLQFQAPDCVIPARITIAGRFAADNGATLFIDANQVRSSVGTPNYGFLPGGVTSFSAPVPPTPTGLHAIRLVVRNASNVTGAIVQGTIAVTCPGDPAVNTGPGNPRSRP
jgi:hypothetical protein